MISVEKALKTILVNFRPLGLEKINILEARKRVMAKMFSPRTISLPPIIRLWMATPCARLILKARRRLNLSSLKLLKIYRRAKSP